ncbi:MAG: PepSY domain-containing protein [Devosia sp.]
MRKPLLMLAVLAALSSGPAFAGDDCFVPMAEWQPREAVVRLAAENGWSVRRIKVDDGCYEIDGQDAGGRRIKVTVHPSTLAVIEFQYKDDDVGARKRSGQRNRLVDIAGH